MNHQADTLSRWTFSLMDQTPGPSVGDAFEYLERLGFDPRSWAKLELVNEVTAGRYIVATFVVTAPAATVNRLDAAHRKCLRKSSAGMDPRRNEQPGIGSI